MYFMQIHISGKNYTRQRNYDIGLIRLDYPIADPKTGMTILPGGPSFSMDSIMPICLPPNKDFKDTGVEAVAVGLGITAEAETGRCFTDGNGPSAFQTCANQFGYPLEKAGNLTDGDFYDE